MDALKYYESEPTIKQIWSYLEGFHNGAGFMRAVQKTTLKKGQTSDPTVVKIANNFTKSVPAVDAVYDAVDC